MKTSVGWITLTCLGVLILFEGLLLGLGQFGHDFNAGGPSPASLQYGWLLLVLQIAGLVVSRRTGLPLLIVGIIGWVYGVLFFQLHTRHLSFGASLGEGWFDSIFVLLAAIYLAVQGRWWGSRSAS
jgi:hypothetical protein